MTINRHGAEMGELHIKLIHEQQKTERQIAMIEQDSNQMRELQLELKASLTCLISSWSAASSEKRAITTLHGLRPNEITSRLRDCINEVQLGGWKRYFVHCTTVRCWFEQSRFIPKEISQRCREQSKWASFGFHYSTELFIQADQNASSHQNRNQIGQNFSRKRGHELAFSSQLSFATRGLLLYR